MSAAVDTSFAALGTTVRLLLDGDGAQEAAAAARRWIGAFDACASRFRADSELSRLNADPRERVPVSPLLAAAIGAGAWAAQRTGGLVDPVLVDALQAGGYAGRWDPARAMDLRTALDAAPARRPAAADPGGRWRAVHADGDAGVVTRPGGLHLDTGGTGKGLAADALLHVVGPRRAVIDLGGDIALSPGPADPRPFEVEVTDPFSRRTSHVLSITAGAVATSGIDARLWAGPDGPSHHLLDPSTGRPAWTGIVSVTALAPTVLEAEVLAKAALLSGPAGAAPWLAEHGGLVVHDDGEVRAVGPLAARAPAAVIA
ncbi:FAD:protein FMN transferase [Baekduia soli]|uniref:FAD:protein FMN transferase n=1 Tax=Baekduia soli TaxID=496014 RepID=UPI0016524D8A|nr:FAD:protein FMN transferase [Baekduia soli]